MKKEYLIINYTIRVSFSPKIVHIINDKELEYLLSEELERGTQELVKLIKEDYFKKYHETLQISDDSMIIEIWGHVYFEYFTVLATRIFPMAITDKIAGWVIQRCETIDSGEGEVDIDRKFWNSLIPFKEIIMTALTSIPVR
jgi:hypothetical protein